jgi:hypothetical protein
MITDKHLKGTNLKLLLIECFTNIKGIYRCALKNG